MTCRPIIPSFVADPSAMCGHTDVVEEDDNDELLVVGSVCVFANCTNCFSNRNQHEGR